MKIGQGRILPFLLFMPLVALASGDYVLTALLIDFILFLIISFSIIKVEMKMTGKVILFMVYIASVYCLLYIINKIDYLANLTLINIGSALFSPVVVYLTYLGIKDKFNKPQ